MRFEDPIHFEAQARFGLSPEELWPFVADTQRLNRSIGLPNAEFDYSAREEGGSFVTGVYRQLRDRRVPPAGVHGLPLARASL